VLEILTLTPILKGLIVITIAGLTFPLAGVYLFRLNLLPMRFMLMHGAILGGSMALAFHINPFWTTIGVNLLLVLFMTRSSLILKMDLGHISMFFMVITISLAFIFIYKFNVPAKDTLALLWGNLYVLSWAEVAGISFFSLLLVTFQYFFRNHLRALFFDREIAFTSGFNESLLYYVVVIVVAITVALAMKLIGALLLDAILLLPPVVASFRAKSLRGMIIGSVMWGGVFATGGFLLSIAIDVPASTAVAALACLVFIIMYLTRKK
jgi:zinc transport system permease protein